MKIKNDQQQKPDHTFSIICFIHWHNSGHTNRLHFFSSFLFHNRKRRFANSKNRNQAKKKKWTWTLKQQNTLRALTLSPSKLFSIEIKIFWFMNNSLASEAKCNCCWKIVSTFDILNVWRRYESSIKYWFEINKRIYFDRKKIAI